MTEVVHGRTELKNTGYEIFIGLLSILSILNLVLLYLFRDDPSLGTILLVMNGLLSGIFLVDFTYRLYTAPHRAQYFFRGYGWADLLASLPLEQAKILRIFRLVRVYRLLRAYGVRNVVLEFGSLGMLRIEQHAPGANITTASDSMWYTIVTISTVGYGDKYPVTNAGRTLGSMIIVVGVGIFGTFTGYLANLFLSPKSRAAASTAPEASDARQKVDAIRDLLVQQQSAVEEVAAML
jgi:Ion channel